MMMIWFSVTLIYNKVADHLVFALLVTVLLVSSRITLDEALSGFGKFGPWVPQLQAIILKSVRDSGLLDSILDRFLGKQQGSSRWACAKLYFSGLTLGTVIGGSPAVAAASPVVARWAECYSFPLRPMLYLLVVAAACGNVMLLTSAPASVVIAQMLCGDHNHCRLSVFSPAPLALIVAAVLGVYAVCVGRRLSSASPDPPEQRLLQPTPRVQRPRARTGFDDGVESSVEMTSSSEAMSTEQAEQELGDRLEQLEDPEAPEEGGWEEPEVPGDFARGPGSWSSYDSSPQAVATSMVARSFGRGRSERPRHGPGDLLSWWNPRGSAAGRGLRASAGQLAALQLHYEVDFVVVEGSRLVGHTPRSAGLPCQEGLLLTAISRASSSTADPGLACASAEEPGAMAEWCFQAGDLISARCSARGIVTVRQRFPKLFVMHGLACHFLLGSRRSERSLFEGVLAEGSSLAGRSLEEILCIGKVSQGSSAPNAPEFVKTFRGYPIAAWRREGEQVATTRPLSSSGDRLSPGDVVLVDAFEEFPSLPQTLNHFVTTSRVPNSQAPRHGRRMDRIRSMMGIWSLLLAILLEDLRYLDLLVGYLCVIALLVSTKALRVHQAIEAMEWRYLITTGLGQGISIALRNTGVAGFLGSLLCQAGRVGGITSQLFALAFLAQVAAYNLSPTPAALIIAPIAMSISQDGGFRSEALSLLVIVSCNVRLTVPSTGAAAKYRCTGTTDMKELLLWGVPAQLIMTIIVVAWTMLVYIKEWDNGDGHAGGDRAARGLTG